MITASFQYPNSFIQLGLQSELEDVHFAINLVQLSRKQKITLKSIVT